MLMSIPWLAKANPGKRQIAARILVNFRCMVASKRGNAAKGGILSRESYGRRPSGLEWYSRWTAYPHNPSKIRPI
jgi:hypothetical protein